MITPITEPDELVRKQLGFRGPQNVNVPFKKYTSYDWARLLIKQKRKAFYNHMPAIEIKKYVGQHIWNKYFKFCFERNPYDKVISHYFWMGGHKKFGGILKYLQSEAYMEIQGVKMYTHQGEVLVDRIFQFETLNESIEKLSDTLNIHPKFALPTYRAKSSTRTDHRLPEKVLTTEEMKAIEQIFHLEFNLLTYPLLSTT